MVWLIINLVAATSLLVYVFLSADGQSKLGIKLLAIVAAVIVVANAVVEALQKDRPYSFAYVARDGTILKGHNFPWKLQRDSEGRPDFMIFDRYDNAAAVTVIPVAPISNKVYIAWAGTEITFDCPKNAVPDFIIEIGD